MRLTLLLCSSQYLQYTPSAYEQAPWGCNNRPAALTHETGGEGPTNYHPPTHRGTVLPFLLVLCCSCSFLSRASALPCFSCASVACYGGAALWPPSVQAILTHRGG